ncbi:MAG: zinc-ribbon domain-containing protein [Eubacteriales bacterium]|nr:zinc-ribbon domain-containing protein [Eubacteriales bacterium]
MDHKCPHCGNPLPKEASFCPHCAKPVSSRSELKPPKRIPVKIRRALLFCLLILLAGICIYIYTRPKTYDSMSEVTYTDSDGTYQVIMNVSNDRYQVMSETRQSYGDEERYRFPVRLYINHKDTGADASGIFMKKVKRSSVRIDQPESETPINCSDPLQNDGYPEAAQISLIDFFRQSPEQSQIIWTLEMENGDIIRLRMNFYITFRPIFNYSSENADLSDAAALQAFIDKLAEERDIDDIVNIYLPPVTYTDTIVIHDRPFNFYGLEKDGQRPVFTAGIQMRPFYKRTWITYFNDIDFIGDGSGIGLSVSNRAWAKGCRFLNLKTGILAFGTGATWVNATNCVFENNITGLHFNAVDGSPSDERFTENEFTNNETAVLLENVPTDVRLDFSDSVFTHNLTDIDNRCEQPIDTANAVFQ